MARYRRSPTQTMRVSDQELQGYVRSLLMARTGRRESISFLIQTIRESGGLWVPTNLNEAESVFERLGFRLERDTNQYGSVLRTYVIYPL